MLCLGTNCNNTGSEVHLHIIDGHFDDIRRLNIATGYRGMSFCSVDCIVSYVTCRRDLAIETLDTRPAVQEDRTMPLSNPSPSVPVATPEAFQAMPLRKQLQLVVTALVDNPSHVFWAEDDSGLDFAIIAMLNEALRCVPVLQCTVWTKFTDGDDSTSLVRCGLSVDDHDDGVHRTVIGDVTITWPVES